ncbi:P-type conjugative transfer protein TrbJ [Magnetospirillum fulvum]|uniref:P-type conjugative transfer protein TrbJ n=1 Tax=Magnetospirillum fulvum TaxID=1082 RepID=A0A1H6JB95_MAGFU|nr:P-type conjugative transfer protein TrbJ [Magnetospirillum fulvum]SEH59355.1 P-type conjugative transfer protein TrbJ [Magnetospirillum fulvum]
MTHIIYGGASAPRPDREAGLPGPALNKITAGLGAALPGGRGRQPAAKLLLISILLIGLSVPPAQAQWAVFDASNFAENVLQAARAMEQINNQIRSLQNEAAMLETMNRNLQSLDSSSLGQMTTALSRINGLMNQANGIAFTLDATDSAFQRQFPSQYGAALTSDQSLAAARTRWQSAMSAYRQTMLIQSQVNQNVQADTNTLADLVNASQGAAGSLQAQQAANQLIALTAKQQMQIQTLMAAQYRAEALEQARKAQSEASGQAATARFLGSGTAYSGR